MSNCRPCRTTYNNRLNETKQETKVEQSTQKSTTIKCGKEIISITQVGTEVIVLYNDCSYSKVSTDKVSMEVQPNEQKDLPKVTNIAESNGKVIVTLDNGNFIETGLEVIDKSLLESLADGELNKITKLTEFIENLKDNLEPVMDLGGKISHYVLKTTFIEGN